MPFVKGHVHSTQTRIKLSKAGKGRKPWNAGLDKSDPRIARISELTAKKNRGRKLSPEHKKKLSEAFSGEKSSTWKGDKVSYSGIHKWIYKQLGKPDTCEHCYKSGLSGHKIHWANKSGRYLRDPSDWIRLCAKCHIKYDNIGNRAWVTRRKAMAQVNG